MMNASFDRSDPRDTTRGSVSLAPHANSSMGGAGMRNTKAWGAVDGLVRTETILVKRLHSRQRTSFNAAELAVPKILHQMLCTAASDQLWAVASGRLCLPARGDCCTRHMMVPTQRWLLQSRCLTPLGSGNMWQTNQFSAVVDKVMVGSTVEMRRLADEAMKVAYMPSESRRLQASLPKNHVQPQFDINLRLTTLNFYENREKSSGVC